MTQGLPQNGEGAKELLQSQHGTADNHMVTCSQNLLLEILVRIEKQNENAGPSSPQRSLFSFLSSTPKSINIPF